MHHYWLDEGSTVFDQIADPAKKVARLLGYDIRPFLAVRPTAATEMPTERNTKRTVTN